MEIMKKIALILSIILAFTLACTEKDLVTPVQLSDLSEYHMMIIPQNPASTDEIRLIILGDCTYNVLSGVTKSGNTIEIQKTFNSMMKWPCVMTNDTILIGTLQEGKYTVNYKLVDLSTQVTDKIAANYTFTLPVSK